jgi:hypothetical protein
MAITCSLGGLGALVLPVARASAEVAGCSASRGSHALVAGTGRTVLVGVFSHQFCPPLSSLAGVVNDFAYYNTFGHKFQPKWNRCGISGRCDNVMQQFS